MRSSFFSALLLVLLIVSTSPTLSVQERPEPLLVMPFEFENNRVRLTVEIGGASRLMLLDSGASTTVLFSNMHGASADLPTVGRKQILFPALEEKIGAAALAPTLFSFDDYLVELSDLVLLDDKKDLRSRLLLRYDGILGQEFFARFTVEIDPKKRVMRLYPKGTDLSSLYRTVHDVYVQDEAPHIRFRSKMPWEQSPSMKEMLIDTGYPGAIVFWDSGHYRRAAKLTPDASKQSPAIVGRANFKFGRLRFLQTPVYLGAYPPRQVGKRDGLIGASILNNFNYAIDLSGGRMWMLAKTEGANYSRQFDGTFYPPNGDPYVMTDFAKQLPTGPKTTIILN